MRFIILSDVVWEYAIPFINCTIIYIKFFEMLLRTLSGKLVYQIFLKRTSVEFSLENIYIDK